MNTLEEIEAAAGSLPPDQQEALLLFLASRLRSERAALPTAARNIARERIEQWIADDRLGMQNFLSQ